MPFPMMNSSLALALSERGYNDPTPVQLAVLEPEAEGRDLLVSAQTGSGKTVAFGTAIATTLLGEAERFASAGPPLALIVAPTRELALQVQRELEWLYGKAGGKIASCVGGMDIRKEARALAAGCHIVVGTPGRLKDHIERKRLDLTALKAVVLDEADEMLDLGFREDLEFILGATPTGRRTLMFSATIAHEIATLAKKFQKDAFRIATSNQNQAHGDIEYKAIRIVGSETERAVVNVLRFYDCGATLVFCGTREAVKRLHGSLLERGFAAVALSGELSQAERTSALQSLRDGRSKVCVATDVAARGLDLPDLGLVIHADLPNDRETLLHRSGRTGRAGRKGVCILLVPPFKRRRAEMLIRSANIQASWAGAPSADEIRAKDQERLLSDDAFTEEMADDDLATARAMMEKRTPEEVALALVRVLRARLPAPEDVSDPGQGTFKDRRPNERGSWEDRKGGDKPHFRDRDRAPSGTYSTRDREPMDAADRGPPRDRLNAEDTVWFRINVGRDRNAEPRWLIPLICKAGGITKAEIGSIRIFDTDTRFQILKANANAFGESVKGKNENNTVITPAFGEGSSGPGAGHAGPRPAGDARAPFKKGPFKHKKDFGGKDGFRKDFNREPRAGTSSDKPAGDKPFAKSYMAKESGSKDGFQTSSFHNEPRADGAPGDKPAGEKPFKKPYKPKAFGGQDGGFRKEPRPDGAPAPAAGDKTFVKPYKAKKKHKAQQG